MSEAGKSLFFSIRIYNRTYAEHAGIQYLTIPLYEEIYLHKDRTYWKQLEQEAAKMAQEAQCKYVDNKKYAHSPKEFYSRASSSIGYK